MQYIPQAAPFEMIDELIRATESAALTSFTIREGHLFVVDNHFAEPGLIENMAQTAAAGTGFQAAKEGKSAPVGFIGAIKNLRISALPSVGDTIQTTVTFLHQVMQAHIVQAEVRLHEQVIASATLNIFLQ